MAAAFIINALQVNFDSILVLYEQDLEPFFDTAFVKDGDILCGVSGKFVAVTEDRFTGVFEFPTEGLIDLSDVPQNLVFDARSIFSKSGESVQFSCKKRLMKYEFRLLNDILEKSITVKAGSFDSVPQERFLMMMAISFGIKGDPEVTLGEAKTFPPSKILTAKMVGTYVAKQKHIDGGTEGDEPVKTTVVVAFEKAAVKRRPAPAVTSLLQRKRTTVGRAASSKEVLAIVTVAQDVEPLSVYQLWRNPP
ncbi:hypothetical protein F511_40936 [Dorcoceras hygrometricum]|uniref:Uncharacterized protein n=1 Tax=Dorcoceras hygrometricum TaxID=472368 RepID=A0A2Z7AS39_9LAMI|nr:hypothetical protein F511_40936 [Dorcoceras hygrometricum]